MSNDEKVTWIAALWLTSLITAGWFGASVALGWEGLFPKSPILIPVGVFAALLIIWLFRVTYVSGSRRRYED